MAPRSRLCPQRFDPASALVLAAFAGFYACVALIRGLPLWVSLLYAGASVLAFALYGIDKSAARAGRERLSESMLLSAGFVGGWPGALIAQQVFRHKTSKRSFRLRFRVSVIANVAVFAWAALSTPHAP